MILPRRMAFSVLAHFEILTSDRRVGKVGYSLSRSANPGMADGQRSLPSGRLRDHCLNGQQSACLSPGFPVHWCCTGPPTWRFVTWMDAIHLGCIRTHRRDVVDLRLDRYCPGTTRRRMKPGRFKPIKHKPPSGIFLQESETYQGMSSRKSTSGTMLRD
jgi:hypothetical protein